MKFFAPRLTFDELVAADVISRAVDVETCGVDVAQGYGVGGRADFEGD